MGRLLGLTFGVAWDEENKGTSRLPINAVKFLGRDSVVATVGYEINCIQVPKSLSIHV